MDGITAGRIVHYVLKNGEHRPAIIVRTWSQGAPYRVNLCVFLDGANDRPGEAYDGEAKAGMLLWATSVPFDDLSISIAQPIHHTWHWVER